jgi:YggT family protein
METFLAGADAVTQFLRTALFSIAVVFGAICVLDWAVRTRKISPFNAVARFCRSTVDPFISPIERKVVRAGGTPASAPLWALAIIVIGGILLLTLLDFIKLEVIRSIVASQEGAAGIFHLLVG